MIIGALTHYKYVQNALEMDAFSVTIYYFFLCQQTCLTSLMLLANHLLTTYNNVDVSM